MKHIELIKKKYIGMGMHEKNIDYAIDAVKDHVKRVYIIENLTCDYRKETLENSNLLLDDLFKANGGEFKQVNRFAIFIGSLLLIGGTGWLIYYIEHIRHDFAAREIGLIIIIIILGLIFIIKGILKQHREDVI
jgi:hypothetical protein